MHKDTGIRGTQSRTSDLLRGGEATQQGTGHEAEVLKSMVEGQECNRGTMRTRIRSRCPDTQERSSSACVWRGVVWDGVGSGVVWEGHRLRGRTSAKASPGAHSSREGTGPVSLLAFSCPPFTPISMCVRVRGRRSGGEKRTREKDKREKDKTSNAGSKACRPAHACTPMRRGVQVRPGGAMWAEHGHVKSSQARLPKFRKGLEWFVHASCLHWFPDLMVIQWFPHASTGDATRHWRRRRQARPFALLDPSTSHLLSASFYGNSHVCLRHTRRAPDPLPSAHHLLFKTLTQKIQQRHLSEQM
jgi:hypothetical protein